MKKHFLLLVIASPLLGMNQLLKSTIKKIEEFDLTDHRYEYCFTQLAEWLAHDLKGENSHVAQEVMKRLSESSNGVQAQRKIFMKLAKNKAYRYDKNLEILEGMIQSGFDVNFNDEDLGLQGGTPLHHSAWTLDVPAIKALLTWGANPTVKDRRGKTPYESIDMWGFNTNNPVVQEVMGLVKHN